MKISFIIPVYNCKAYLEACVDSIRAAGVETYEILLVDDGATDGSGALCDELAARFPEVRVVHQANAGVSAARNRGIEEATGDYILFVDSDDTVDAAKLRTILEQAVIDDEDLTVFGMRFDYYHRGSCYRQDELYYPADGRMEPADWGAHFQEMFERNTWSPLWNKVFRRSILEQYHLRLNEQMFLYEDFEFVLRYLAHCGTIRNVPEAVYQYRQSEDEGNAGRRLRRIDSIPRFLEPIEESLRKLQQANPAVTAQQADAVLQQLHLVLSREKMHGAGLQTIRQVCCDFNRWADGRTLPLEVEKFQRLMEQEQAGTLYLADRKTTVRHWIAVRVKALLRNRKGIL